MPNALYRNKNTNWDNGREYDVSTGDYTGVVDQLYRPSTVKDNFYKNNGVKAPVGGALVQNEYGSGITQDGINFISQDGTTPIMPSALTSEKPLTMPTTPPVSTTVDTTAQAAATSAQTATDAQIASNASKQELKSEGQGIMDIVNNIANQPTKQQAQYEEQGLLEKKAEIDRISLEMSQANQRAQKEIDTIQAQNPGGLIGSGASTRIRQIQRENAAYQADRAFGLAALQGNYTAAKDAIDAKIEAETSGMKLQLEAKKYFYEQNREDFTKEEQRAYEEILRKDERKYDETVKDKELLGSTMLAALKNAQERGAPASVIAAIKKAKTPEDVIDVAGVYGTDLQRALSTEKIRRELESVNEDFIFQGKDKFDAELKLAANFNTRAGNFKKAAPQIANIRSSYKQAISDAANGKSINASSQGVLVAFQKLLDPESVVRESEYARSGAGLSLISRLEGFKTKLEQGGAGVTAEDLKEFVTVADTFLRGYEDSAISEAQLIIEQATPVGLDITKIIPANVLELMDIKFEEALKNAKVGETINIGNEYYVKTGEDTFDPQ